MLRAIVGFVIALVIAFVSVIAGQYVVNMIFPLPKGLDVFDRAAVDAVFRAMPPSHFALILLTYLLGGLLGGFAAIKIGQAAWPAWTVAVIIALTAALNVFTYPHPVWAQIGGIAAPLIGTWIALRLAGPIPVRDDYEDDAREPAHEEV